MWPFTGKRIFASRWWALGFVVFVCWQAVDIVDSASDATNSSQSVGGAPGN